MRSVIYVYRFAFVSRGSGFISASANEFVSIFVNILNAKLVLGKFGLKAAFALEPVSGSVRICERHRGINNCRFITTLTNVLVLVKAYGFCLEIVIFFFGLITAFAFVPVLKSIGLCHEYVSLSV